MSIVSIATSIESFFKALKISIGPIFTNFIADLKERFINFETVHGIWLTAIGCIGIFITLLHVQYILHIMGAIIFGSAIIYGLYSIFHNPIAKLIATEELKFKNFTRNAFKYPNMASNLASETTTETIVDTANPTSTSSTTATATATAIPTSTLTPAVAAAIVAIAQTPVT